MKKYSCEFKARAVEKALGRDPDVSLNGKQHDLLVNVLSESSSKS